jgi:hypothetical protein
MSFLGLSSMVSLATLVEHVEGAAAGASGPGRGSRLVK